MSQALRESDFQRIVAFVRERYGINLAAKRTLIEARLTRHIAQRGFDGFAAYINFVMSHPDSEECQRMINRLSTNYSFFFREPDYIAHFTSKLLPELSKRGQRSLTIWSAACASGQEVYSIAMALAYAIRLGCYPISFHIIGSDINTDVLAHAARGVYDNQDLTFIPQKYRPFTRRFDGDHFTITDELKQMVEWKRQNLLEKFPERTTYDLVFCRNVLIYFDAQTRKRLIGTLFDSLKCDGYLYVGVAESVDLEHKYFSYVAPAIYRKGEPR